jgi:cysteine-rich repeat protein
MKKYTKDLLTILVITSCIILGSAFSYAFRGPTAVAPLNNATGPIDSSITPQAKGGPVVPGSLLNINGTTSANYLVAWNDFVANQKLTVGSLAGVGVRPVCTDGDKKLIICAPMCGDGFITSGESCDDGNTNNNDSCRNDCTINPTPSGGGPGAYYVCFIAQTKISMADGTTKNIEDVQIGDILKGEKTNNKVLAFHRPPKSEGVIYGFNGEKPFVTEEHPFKTTQGWKSINPDKTRQENIGIEVTQLSVGDTLITETGNTYIFSIESKKVPETTHLYNFVLSGDRTYFADGYLVHNKAACEAGNPGPNPDPNSDPAPCLDQITHLFALPPSGDVLPVYCPTSSIGQIYVNNTSAPGGAAYIGGCGGSFRYQGCYTHNGGPGREGIRACGNVAPY